MRNQPMLGASLYVPATHPDLAQIASAQKLANVRSLIFCTEDSVAPADLSTALAQLAEALPQLQALEGRLRFVRARNLEVLRQILAMPGIERIDGFVLPKVTADNIDHYMALIAAADKPQYWVMPTLETREVFNDHDLQQLLRRMDGAQWREHILSLRIGGNDLLSLLRMRRPRGHTIYATPIGQVISRLATTFIPYGFSLTAPVFEHLDDTQTLYQEIEQDLNHGLVGKTAIHPSQVPLIEQCYRVRPQDVEAATRILQQDAPGVFQMHQSMCEPATHRPWAHSILAAERCFGRVENKHTPPQVPN
ncbi:HpcH/HpaI aldolase/citrate lyase family protein [Uliginosibacterium gangwonense]|uniref:HpcH/HpaI aldolase/citrate lyase family protein n=1 Tax=Uliginosibacterium gangwonense TaxID=392736 RepID=UPI0003601381|nr:HpcH/HpaI aldolase/citrate lyase family protein [Uliginosibacterium gangwonense]